jgi:outer membrane protein assembly factor BamE
MVVNSEAARLGDLDLPFFDFRVIEFFDEAALNANQVIVVPALVQLEHSLARFEVMAYEQPRLLKLREDPVDGCKTGIGAFLEQHLVDVLRAQMTHRTFLEQLQNAQPWERRFEADRFEIVGRTHFFLSERILSYHIDFFSLWKPRMVGLGEWQSGLIPADFMRRIILMAFLVAGCQQVPMLPTLTPYKIDVQQGNYVNQEMVAKLKPGMTRAQVRFILGTPLVVDPFRTDRWDYVYLLNKGGEVTAQRRIAVIFEQDKLKRIEGDVVAASPGSTKDKMEPPGSGPTEAKPQPAGGSAAKPEGKKPELDVSPPASPTVPPQ